MASDIGNRKKRLKAIVIAIIVLVGVYFGYGDEVITILENYNIDTTQVQEYLDEFDQNKLYMHMINVGQGDSFLFVQGDETALVDCGPQSAGDDVVNYLDKLGIEELDLVIITHPHEDHMGGLYQVLTNKKVDRIVMPKVKQGLVVSQWYLKDIRQIKTSRIPVTYPNLNDVFEIGSSKFKLVGMMTSREVKDDNINNYSLVFKVSFGNMDVLMTGDAEKELEEKLVKSGADIDAEILKIAHHGSKTSSTDEFLDAVNPDYAFISAKKGNDFKHPHKDTMDKLEERRIVLFRTDELGTVIATIGRNNVTFDKKTCDYLNGSELCT